MAYIIQSGLLFLVLHFSGVIYPLATAGHAQRFELDPTSSSPDTISNSAFFASILV